MKKETFHVLHVITGLRRGGAETMLYKLVASLRTESGFRHSIVSLLSACEFDFASLGVPVQSLGMRRGIPTPGALLRLRAAIRSTSPDLVHGWMYHGNLASSAALAGGGEVPLVWGIRQALQDLSVEKRTTRLLINAGRVLALQRRLRAIVYCSDLGRRHHEAIGYPPAKSVYIPNGFDCVRFSPSPVGRRRVRSELGAGDDEQLVGCVARYHPVKNQVGLVRAFASIASRHPRAMLVLAGLGVDEGNPVLFDALRESGCGARIRMLGEREDVPDLLSAFDLFALASHSEGFPNVIGEAMACGLPCVTTGAGDAALIVGDTGFVAPVGDCDALAGALDTALGLPDGQRRALGVRARSVVVDRYSLGSVADRYASLYRSVRVVQ